MTVGPVLSSPLGSVLMPATGDGGVTYDPDAAAYFARISSQPSAARKAALNTLVIALKTGGVWSNLDALVIHASHDTATARLNAVANQFNATLVNSPDFLTDRGYAGDGSSSYLDSQFNPSTGTPKYAQNSAHLGVWSLTDAAASVAEIGARATSIANQAILFPRSAINQMLARVNLDTGAATPDPGNSLGHFVGVRTAASVHVAYKDGAELASDASTSTAPPNLNFFLGAGNTGGTPGLYSTRRVAIRHWGAGLTAAQVLAAKNAFQTYLTTIGAI